MASPWIFDPQTQGPHVRHASQIWSCLIQPTPRSSWVAASFTGRKVHSRVQVEHEIIAGVKIPGLGPPTTAKLVHPRRRFRRPVHPFVGRVVEEVDIPGRSTIRGDEFFGKGLTRDMRRKRIIKVPYARVAEGGRGDTRRGLVVVEPWHLNPNDGHTHIGGGKVLKN